MTTTRENKKRVDSKQVDQENNESVDSKEVDAQPKELEQDKQQSDDSEMMESEQVDMEITDSKAADLKPVVEPDESQGVVVRAESQGVVVRAESQGVAEPVDSHAIIAPVEPEGVIDPAGSQPVSEPVEPEGVIDPAGSQPVSEPVVSQDTIEPVEPEGVIDPAGSQPVSEPVVSQDTIEPVEPEGVIDPAGSQPVAEPVVAQDTIEPVEPEGVIDPAGSQPVVEPVVSQDIIEPVEPQGVVDPAGSQAAAEPVEPQGVVDPAESQAAVEPVESQGITEPVEPQGVVDPAETQAAVEPVESQGIIEPVESQGVADPSESQGAVEGVESQGIIEPVEVQDAREERNLQAVTEPVDSLPVNEPVDSQAFSEPVDSQAATEPMDTEPMDTEPMDTEPMDSQPMSAEHAHTQPMGEVTYSHVVTSERISEPTGSQGFTEQVATQVVSEQIHPQTVSEPAHSIGVSEAMDTQPINIDLAHPQPLSEEDLYSHPVSSEHMHLQPVSQGLVYSQPPTSEHLHLHQVGAEQVHAHAVSSELVPLPHVNLHLQQVGAELVNANAHPHEVEFANSHGVGMEAPNNTQPLATEMTEYQQTTPETQPNKRRKKKSIVWEHFTIETVSAGCRRACCKVCKQSFAYSTGSKVAGTSHLKRHIAKGTCPVILRQQEKNQLSPYTPKSGGTDASTDPPKRRYRSSNSQYLMFDQDRCRHEIARMIIMHDYPLHMVEHPGFVSFVQNLQPRFDMVSFNIVQGDCVATFLREKQDLLKFIEGIPGRMCLTLDMWTSSQSTGYVFVTGQFIDNDWKLHRRLLNVVMEPFPESDRALSHAVGTCLSDWGVERKLASVTFNQPLSETAVENMRALLAVKNSMLLNGQLLVRSCLARTLSSMAQDVFGAGQETIKKIRSSVKYVMTSESHEEKFLELKQHLQVPTEKSLSLNNTTKWNTTYEMLLAASELKEVFSCLDTSDPEYKDAPSMEEWKQVENICSYLKLLYDAANMLTMKDAPSSNVFFHEVWKIQLELARAAASDDPFVSDLAKPLQDKFHKYWKNSCLVLAIAVAMDPRFKMKLVEFSFTKIFGEEAPVFIRVVDEGIHELFHEYVNLPLPLTPAYAEGANGGNVKSEADERRGGSVLTNNGLSDFDMYIMETTSQQMKSELDQYLEESLLPRVQDFDVLGWWKLNKLKYPTLSKMARDILALPLSTIPPEYVFDTVVKEMDAYRCSLRPETVEALICAKDWLLRETEKVSDSKEIVKMEL